jgi:AcrR family transcriptional regulator
VKRSRELQKQETERQILEVALALFTARGYEATTTKQIAEAAGVAHGTVFLVASTKEALLVKVLEAGLRAAFTERTATLPRRGIAARLLHVFQGLFAFYAAHPALSRVFLRSIMLPADAVAKAHHDEHVAQFVSYLGSLFRAAVAKSELPSRTNIELAASSVFAIYVAAIIHFLNEERPDRRGLDQRFRAGLDLVICGLRA